MTKTLIKVRKILINISLDWSDLDNVYINLIYVKTVLPALYREGNLKADILFKIFEEVVLMMNAIEEEREIDGRVFRFVQEGE